MVPFGIQIASVKFVGENNFYDFHVPETNNYLAAGVINHNSGGKTQFCDGMTISKNCYQLEHLNGFFSGFKDSDGNDYSLLARVLGKCMVTSEGDVLMSNPVFKQIMAQQRRIFDGSSRASYKNDKEDKVYDNIRLTWVIAGTPAMLEKEQASLGDRFLKIYLDSPRDKEKRKISERVSDIAWQSLAIDAGQQGSIASGKTTIARQRTAGYIDWLRENTSKLAEIVATDEDKRFFEDLAFLTAILRARPPKDETPATVEEPHRLTHQLNRMAGMTAFVLNRTSVDRDIKRRIHKIAMDTGKGPVQDLFKVLLETGEPIGVKAASLHIDRNEDQTRKLLRFLKQIRALTVTGATKPVWNLSNSVRELCERVLFFEE